MASFLGTEAALTYVSCWNANTGLTPTFLGEEDAVISDELNHASIIEGLRATKTTRKVYPHSDMKPLQEALEETSGARLRCQISAAHTRDDLDHALAALVKVGRELGLLR